MGKSIFSYYNNIAQVFNECGVYYKTMPSDEPDDLVLSLSRTGA